MLSKINTRLLYTVVSAAIILLGTFVAIEYAKGSYRLTQQGFLRGTGLLSANSFPTGAQLYIDGRLSTATDDTLYLDPGEYTIEVLKDGYSPWRKNLLIEEELVTQTNARLFPIAPTLTPLTFTGAENVSPSPDGQKIIYYTASTSAVTRNGLYLLELSDNPLAFQRGTRQIAESNQNLDLSTAQFIWSPDSSEAMMITEDRTVLLDLNRRNDLSTLPDVSLRQRQILSGWEEEMYLREREFLSLFPPAVIEIATTSARNVYFSPDKKRLLYTATAAATVPEGIVSPVPAANTQPQNRQLEPGSIYVYDREEDRNFKIGEELNSVSTNDKLLLATDLANRQPLSLNSSPSGFLRLQASDSAQTIRNFQVYHTSLFASTLQWLADSRHLVYSSDSGVRVISYDGTNDTLLYAGPYAENFVYPWPDGSKLLILTSFSPDSPKNLYGIELR